jgi:hypothetical protein
MQLLVTQLRMVSVTRGLYTGDTQYYSKEEGSEGECQFYELSYTHNISLQQERAKL